MAMDIAQTLHQFISHNAAWLLFFNILAVQAGLPLPAYPALIVAGSLAQSGTGLPLAQVLAVGVLACVLADLGWYWLGRRHGTWMMRGICRISLSPDTCVRKSTHLYLHVGPRLLLVAKFLPGAGALTTLMAGSSGTRPLVFLLYDAAGAAIWVSAGLMLGVFFERAVLDLLALLASYAAPGFALLAAVFVAWLAWKLWQRWRVLRRSGSVPRMAPEALRDLLDSGEPHVVLDTRPGEPKDGIPGQQRMQPNVPFATLDRLPKDRPIIAYCECPREVSAAYLAERIRSTGHPDVHALAGGLDAWKALDLGAAPPLADPAQQA